MCLAFNIRMWKELARSHHTNKKGVWVNKASLMPPLLLKWLSNSESELLFIHVKGIHFASFYIVFSIILA